MLHQFSHAFLAQQHQSIQFLRAEGRALGRALNFDDVARSREHHVHIAVAAGIFGIIQIQERHAAHHAGRHGRHGFADGVVQQHAGIHKLVYRHLQRHKSAGDGGGACAAVGLDYIAID